MPSLYDQAVLWLDEYESLDWGVALSPPYRLLSNFCIRKGLGRKANFAQSMAAYLARRSGEQQAALGPCLPHTVVLDLYAALHSRPRWLDRESALAEALSSAAVALPAGVRVPADGDAAEERVGLGEGVRGGVALPLPLGEPDPV